MDYNGGPVMPSNTDYMVLWSPAGLSAYPAGYVSGLETFFTDLAHDSGGHQNADSVSAQYNDLTGAFARYQTTFGGALVDTDPYPPTQCPAAAPVTACLTDPQIQTELEHFVASRGLKTDLSHEYFLLTPPHVESCFSNDPNASPPFGGCSAGEPRNLALFCAYHQNTSLSPMLIYANDPFDATNPGCQDGNNPNGIAGGEINGGLSHEQNESVTDPLPNDAWTNGAGANQGEEVGDQCVGMFGTPLGTHQRRQVQPGDQWPLLLVPGGVEQSDPFVPAAAHAGGGTAARQVQGHRGLRADPELRRPRLERTGRCCRIRLAVQ